MKAEFRMPRGSAKRLHREAGHARAAALLATMVLATMVLAMTVLTARVATAAPMTIYAAGSLNAALPAVTCTIKRQNRRVSL